MDKPFLDKLRKIDPYVPGEQPKTDNIIKLNANENPYPPAPSVTEVLRTFDAAKLAIYPDANAKALKTAIAERFDLQPSQVFLGNGSDDVLALAFQSFFCSDKPILYPDITYSFYPVWCDLFRIPYENMPLDEDFCVNVRDYDKPNGGIVLPNPNAPTGRGVTLEFLEDLLQHNQDCVVIIDEAYVDFGAQSAVPLLDKYENLLIVQTTSKSRSLAGKTRQNGASVWKTGAPPCFGEVMYEKIYQHAACLRRDRWSAGLGLLPGGQWAVGVYLKEWLFLSDQRRGRETALSPVDVRSIHPKSEGKMKNL